MNHPTLHAFCFSPGLLLLQINAIDEAVYIPFPALNDLLFHKQ